MSTYVDTIMVLLHNGIPLFSRPLDESQDKNRECRWSKGKGNLPGLRGLQV